MQDRQQHQQEVLTFLQTHFSSRHWEFSLPKMGTGHETYFACGNGHNYFIKLGVQIARYEAMSSLSLTPQVLASGYLEDGTSLVVQPCIAGRIPTRKDYRLYLEPIAGTINKMHQSLELQSVLPAASSELYKDVGLEAVNRLQQRWEHYKAQVPGVAELVDESLALLARQVHSFRGAGLVASHNDICNANWLISSGGQIYLVDLELMSLDDPACDIGATLWWYYPPELRHRFLEIVGHADDEQFQLRMQVRMALHCLAIMLPRAQSYDEFDPASFAGDLTDFKAIVSGKENPQGYADT